MGTLPIAVRSGPASRGMRPLCPPSPPAIRAPRPSLQSSSHRHRPGVIARDPRARC